MPISKARFRISDYNHKRKTELRRREGRIRMVSLSLTSMVDMFAILVIFLLTNSDSVANWVEVNHGITIPTAKHVAPPPARAATLSIAKDSLYGGDRRLASVAEIAAGPMSVAPLKAWLAEQPKKDGYVNIVADEKLPFAAIRRIVATCQDAGFANINLAVQPKSGG